jgi:hypothetical protein
MSFDAGVTLYASEVLQLAAEPEGRRARGHGARRRRAVLPPARATHPAADLVTCSVTVVLRSAAIQTSVGGQRLTRDTDLMV